MNRCVVVYGANAGALPNVTPLISLSATPAGVGSRDEEGRDGEQMGFRSESRGLSTPVIWAGNPKTTGVKCLSGSLLHLNPSDGNRSRKLGKERKKKKVCTPGQYNGSNQILRTRVH